MVIFKNLTKDRLQNMETLEKISMVKAIGMDLSVVPLGKSRLKTPGFCKKYDERYEKS